jgi:phenylacetate-CoA ligase
VSERASRLARWRKSLPLPLRQGYGWLRRRLLPDPVLDSREYLGLCEWLTETQWWSRAELEAYQIDELGRFLSHAYEQTPYYRCLFDRHGVKPSDIQTLEHMVRIPFTTKADVREHRESMVARNFDVSQLDKVGTGGSTGQPLWVYHDGLAHVRREEAFTRRQWEWMGYRAGARVLSVRGNVRSAISRGPGKGTWDYGTDDNSLFLSSLDMGEQSMDHYIRLIRSFEPEFIDGFPTAIELLLRYAESRNVTIPKPRAVFCQSEKLYPSQRELIARHLGCQVLAAYGMTEAVSDAVECPAQSGYHVNMEYGILEIVDDEGRIITEPHKVGHVVGTGFGNHGMPLIRYMTDDLAMWAEGDCSCGRHSRRVQEFQGREREYVVDAQGQLLPFSSLFGTLFVANREIWARVREIRFMQQVPGQVVAEVVLISGTDGNQTRRQLEHILDTHVTNHEIAFDVGIVEVIPPTTSGKRRLLDQRIPLSLAAPGTVRESTHA